MVVPKLAMRVAVAAGSVALIAGSLVGCSAGGSGSGGKTTITFLVQSGGASPTMAKDMAAAFEAANPDITVKVNKVPDGTDGANLVKTQLSTGTMDDVFLFNSGAALQALNPDKNLVDLSGEAWVADLADEFKGVVQGSTGKGTYGAPMGTANAGGVMYNKKVYADLGLSVPTTWDEFMANSQKIKDSGKGIAPIIQSYADTWTAQLFVLGNFANVSKQDPNWAADFTAHKQSFTEQPALQGFLNQQAAGEAGLFNADFASMTFSQALASLAAGTGAQYPMLTATIGTIQQNDPTKVNDIGVFALPAQKAADTQLTMWEPNAVYIPASTTGDKLVAAKKFVAFINSEAGCEIQNKDLGAAGPYVISTCKVPSDAPALIADIDTYVKAGATAPALEFLSPVVGPNLSAITVEVGSGITSAKDAAAHYDQDAANAAQQLGLKGW